MQNAFRFLLGLGDLVMLLLLYLPYCLLQFLLGGIKIYSSAWSGFRTASCSLNLEILGSGSCPTQPAQPKGFVL